MSNQFQPSASGRQAGRLRSYAATALSLLLAVVGIGVLASPAMAAGSADLSVTITPTTTPIPSGATAQWVVSYQCSSVDPTVTTCDNAVIAVTVSKQSPDGNTIVCTQSGSTSNGDFTATPTGFRGTGPGNSIPVGASGQVTYGCKTVTRTTPDQSKLVATATFTSDSANAAATNTAAPIVVTAQPHVSVDKKLLGDSVLDGTTVYQITGDYIDFIAANGAWDTKNPVLVDTLPAGAVFVSASNGGVYDPATNTVTWPSSAGTNNCCGPDFDVRLRVRYPSTDFGIADTVTNNVKLTSTTVTDETQVSATDSVSHTFRPSTGGSGRFDKGVSPNDTAARAIFKDGTYRWNLAITNTGTVPIGGTIHDYPPCQSAPLDNSLPQDCTDPGFTIASFSRVPAGSVFTFHLADGSTQTVTKTSDGTVDYVVPTGWLIAGYSIELPDDAIDPASTLTINVTGKLTEGVAYEPTTQTNCAQWSLTDAPPTTLVNIGDLDKSCEVAYFKDTEADLRLAKDFTGGVNSLQAGDVAPWALLVSNQGSATDPRYVSTHVHVTDTLPAGVSYVPGSAVVTSAAGAFTYDTDFTTAGLTVTQSGQQLTFTFPADAVLDKQHAFTITFQTTVDAGVGAATHTNEASVWNDDAAAWVPSFAKGSVGRDSFTTGTSAQAGAQKKVKGEYDDAFLASTAGSPAVGSSPDGGTSQWSLSIGSLGSTPIDDLVIYDVFPHVGDTGVSGGQAGQPRSSEFQPTLAGAFTLPAGVTATYSLSTNPCRPEVYPTQPAGCDPLWLSAGAVVDWSAVRAVRIDATAKTYQPGQLEQVTYTMNLPASADPGEVAWNSLAYSASSPGGPLLPAEPVKVGIRVVAPLVDIEKQDAAGHDADIAGDAVALDPEGTTELIFTVTNNGSEALEDVVVSDDVVAGSGTVTGLTCAFPGGSAGTSWTGPFAVGATFECTATLSALGYDATHADTGTVKATGVLSGTSVSDEDDYHGTTPPHIDLSLTKTLVGTGPFHPGDAVSFTLAPHNNGPADAKAGWSVSDLLPQGLTFVSATGTGYDCSGTPAATADVTCVAAAGLSADADGAPITVTATLDADATRTLHNVAWVTPAGDEVTETNPLVVPDTDTDTSTTDTNNDAQDDVTVTPVPAPALSLVKSASITKDADGDDLAGVGDEITFSFAVENTGNVTLKDVAVADQLVAPAGPEVTVTCPTSVLAAGEGMSCTSSVYVVTQADVDAGSVDNAATATGTPPSGPPVVTPPSTTTTPTPDDPGIRLTKKANLADADRDGLAGVGEVIVYEFEVANTGTVTLHDVVVDDPRLGALGLAVDCPAADLAPGESMSCVSDDYTVTADDIEAGVIPNVATATGHTPPGQTVTSPPSHADVDTTKPSGTSRTPSGVLAFTGAHGLVASVVAGLVLLLVGALVLQQKRRTQRREA